MSFAGPRSHGWEPLVWCMNWLLAGFVFLDELWTLLKHQLPNCSRGTGRTNAPFHIAVRIKCMEWGDVCRLSGHLQNTLILGDFLKQSKYSSTKENTKWSNECGFFLFCFNCPHLPSRGLPGSLPPAPHLLPLQECRIDWGPSSGLSGYPCPGYREGYLHFHR